MCIPRRVGVGLEKGVGVGMEWSWSGVGLGLEWGGVGDRVGRVGERKKIY